MPADGWPSSSYLIDTAGQRVLFDCGPGAVAALDRHAAPAELTAVFLSHLHLDHCFDLVVLGKRLVYHPGATRLPLFVPAGAINVLRAVNHLFPIGDAPSNDESADNVFDEVFDVTEYQPAEPITFGSVTVTPVAMAHRIPSHGFRVETGNVAFAYSSDTGPTAAFDTLAADVDLLLVEATLPTPDTTGHGHLSAEEAGSAAARAAARRLVLTHLIDSSPAWIARVRDDASKHFDGPIQVATPGAQFIVDSRHSH
jgi:ribonuclease BN (tRNA processing enzyme)